MDAFSASDPLPPGPLPYADITNPQSLNKYAYTYNNPLNYTDPDGHDVLDAFARWGKSVASALGRTANYVAETVKQTGKELGEGAALIVDGAVNGDQGAMMEGTNKIGATLAPMLAAGGASGLGTGATGAEARLVPTITQNAVRGAASEVRVLNGLGATKNTKPVLSTEGKSIPDFQSSKVLGEIKDAKTVSNTKQLRVQREAAQQSGREHQVVTGTKTHVTNNAAQGTRVIRRDDLGPK